MSKVLQTCKEEDRITDASAKEALDLDLYVMFLEIVSIINVTLESTYKNRT